MKDDDRLKQVWAAEEALAAEYGYNVAAIMEGMRMLDAADPRPTVKLPKPFPPKATATDSVPIKL